MNGLLGGPLLVGGLPHRPFCMLIVNGAAFLNLIFENSDYNDNDNPLCTCIVDATKSRFCMYCPW